MAKKPLKEQTWFMVTLITVGIFVVLLALSALGNGIQNRPEPPMPGPIPVEPYPPVMPEPRPIPLPGYNE